MLVPDGNFDKALRKFKKKVQTSGILDDVKAHEFYQKPTTVRKQKKQAAQKRWARKLADQALPKKQF